MMNDALDLLNDLEEFLDLHRNGTPYRAELQNWIDARKAEFPEPQGDCCG